MHKEDLCEPPGSGLGETYCCWRYSSGSGVSTSLLQQQAAIGTGWRQCCSRCPLRAKRGQHVTLRCKRPAYSQDENDSRAGEVHTRLLGCRPGSQPWLPLNLRCLQSLNSVTWKKEDEHVGGTHGLEGLTRENAGRDRSTGPGAE